MIKQAMYGQWNLKQNPIRKGIVWWWQLGNQEEDLTMWGGRNDDGCDDDDDDDGDCRISVVCVALCAAACC